MIWSDPWIEVATTPSIYRPLCTRLPPPTFAMPAGILFRTYDMNQPENHTVLSKWNTLIQSSWTIEQLRARLQHAWIVCLEERSTIVATCVLRPRTHEGAPFCILETLTVSPSHRRKGYGALLMRCAMRWLWDTYGPFILGYMWELSPAEFAWAWWRGWLRSVAEIRLGWMWKKAAVAVAASADVDASLPLRFHAKDDRFVVISDSGLGDGWGYIQDCSGDIDWSAIAKRGGWKGMWSSVRIQTKEWTWSGEIVVVGLLNYCGRSIPSFRSAEITPRRRTGGGDSRAGESGMQTQESGEVSTHSSHRHRPPPAAPDEKGAQAHSEPSSPSASHHRRTPYSPSCPSGTRPHPAENYNRGTDS